MANNLSDWPALSHLDLEEEEEDRYASTTDAFNCEGFFEHDLPDFISTDDTLPQIQVNNNDIDIDQIIDDLQFDESPTSPGQSSESEGSSFPSSPQSSDFESPLPYNLFSTSTASTSMPLHLADLPATTSFPPLPTSALPFAMQHDISGLPPFCPVMPLSPPSTVVAIQPKVEKAASQSKSKARGTKRTRAVAQKAANLPTSQRVSPSRLLEMANGSIDVDADLSVEDERELKKQRRMIKNRESAMKSRQRRKDQLDELEREVAQLKAENAKLTQRNQFLEDKIKSLTATIEKLKGVASSAASTLMPTKSVSTTGVCMLILIFSCGLWFNAKDAPLMGSALPFDPLAPREPIPPVLPNPHTRIMNGFFRAETPTTPTMLDPNFKLEETYPHPISTTSTVLGTERSETETQPNQQHLDGNENEMEIDVEEPILNAKALSSMKLPKAVLTKAKKANTTWTKTPVWTHPVHKDIPPPPSPIPAASPVYASEAFETSSPAASIGSSDVSTALITRGEDDVPQLTKTLLYCSDVREIALPSTDRTQSENDVSLLIPLKALINTKATGQQLGLLSSRLAAFSPTLGSGLFGSLDEASLVEVSAHVLAMHVYSPQDDSLGNNTLVSAA